MNELIAAALAASAGGLPPSAEIIGTPALARILNAIRTHLDMDVAFISEFRDGRRVFRQVDAREPDGPVQPGGSDALEDSYCQRVVDGRLPELMIDACMNAEALSLAATRALPVGAHLSVPIRLRDGRIYGTFCCFSHAPMSSLSARDLGMMRVFAEVVGEQIQADLSRREAAGQIEQRIDALLDSQGLRMVYQPIVDLAQGRVVGFESLARFAADPYRTPDVWFAEAALVGRELALETLAIQQALQALALLPPEVYVAVNASPEMIVRGPLVQALQGHALERVVVEITEHHVVEHYEDIAAVIQPLQAAGLRLAIDDAGAGYASFRHILNLQPEIVKLDTSITRHIDSDRSRRALAAALRGFAEETDCCIVAEGVETQAELDALRTLRVGKAQGYHLGQPMTLPQARALLH